MDMHGYKSWKQQSHILINFLPSLPFPQKSKQITQFSSQESFREPSTSNKKHILKKNLQYTIISTIQNSQSDLMIYEKEKENSNKESNPCTQNNKQI